MTKQPYLEIYHALAEIEAGYRGRGGKGVRSARNGIHTQGEAFKRFMRGLGMVWTATMQVGAGCKVHLVADELPKGRLVVKVSRHYTAVIDGVIHDTHDPSDRPPTYYFGADGLLNLPKGAVQLRPGAWMYAPKRCVYGYWSFPS